MRFSPLIAVVLCALGCSESRLDLHVLRSASPPTDSKAVESTPCEHCVAHSWVARDDTSIDLRLERDPYLSIPAHRVLEAEIDHSNGIYRPYCDNYVLTLRIGVSLQDMTQAIEKLGNLPTVAIIGEHVVDVGQHIFDGEALMFLFSNKQRAVHTAELLGTSPSVREADDSWQAEMRQQQIGVLGELFDNPEELRRLAEETGIQVENLRKEDLAAQLAQLFCPLARGSVYENTPVKPTDD